MTQTQAERAVRIVSQAFIPFLRCEVCNEPLDDSTALNVCSECYEADLASLLEDES